MSSRSPYASRGADLADSLTPGIRAEFNEIGQTDFVQKPYTLDDLGRRLRSLLDSPR